MLDFLQLKVQVNTIFFTFEDTSNPFSKPFQVRERE